MNKWIPSFLCTILSSACVAETLLPDFTKPPYVFAYQEQVKSFLHPELRDGNPIPAFIMINQTKFIKTGIYDGICIFVNPDMSPAYAEWIIKNPDNTGVLRSYWYDNKTAEFLFEKEVADLSQFDFDTSTPNTEHQNKKLYF